MWGKRTAERFLQNASGENDCAGLEPAQKDDAVANAYLIATSLISNTTATFGGNGVRGSAP